MHFYCPHTIYMVVKHFILNKVRVNKVIKKKSHGQSPERNSIFNY